MSPVISRQKYPSACKLKHVTELINDLPYADSVMRCGLEHSNSTSGQVGRHKDPLVVAIPSLWAAGTFVCHALLCDNKFPMSSFLFFDFVSSLWISIKICFTLSKVPFMCLINVLHIHKLVPDPTPKPIFKAIVTLYGYVCLCVCLHTCVLSSFQNRNFHCLHLM